MTTTHTLFKSPIKLSALACCFALTLGCTAKPPNTFTFTADLPPNFAYVAAAYYGPAEGETCTVATKDNKAPVFNHQWRTDYKPNSEITIRRTRNGCPLVIQKIELEINATYGNTRRDFGGDWASVVIRHELEEQYKGTFNEVGTNHFYGQCQWLFRTAGKKRRIVKILDCKETNAQGELIKGHPFSAYTLDQLPGKTVKMVIRLTREERPYMGDTWVKFPNGWKRCMGENFEDQHAFCYGNYKDFSSFQMPDGTKCTIYPGCTE
ncbi:hypothetical protein SAMN04487857_11626 [Pseudomonas sp. ok272]|uniref:hypothetical protein n=1 Tax=unclassified Pseudomonas TaxID=196821 RepID=UPI0008CA1AB7|nr:MULTISPECIES: hypothetical protein [unclassified Pseudomonas]SEN42031.1 hypothetical protein SAMN04487857_11626 [Pseudomonas sp. ok272]SFN26386.1 hypothetical protein SAMN04487858_11665 [Pseudomonas sp. ok602]